MLFNKGQFPAFQYLYMLSDTGETSEMQTEEDAPKKRTEEEIVSKREAFEKEEDDDDIDITERMKLADKDIEMKEKLNGTFLPQVTLRIVSSLTAPLFLYFRVQTAQPQAKRAAKGDPVQGAELPPPRTPQHV